ALEVDLADVDLVRELAVDAALVPAEAAGVLAGPGDASLGAPAARVQDIGRGDERLLLLVDAEELAYQDRLVLVDDELAAFHAVAERHAAADPFALLARGGHLVARSLGDHLALELGEAHEHVQREPAHRIRGGEVLRYADERHARLVEAMHHLREVEERTRQPIDLIDDYEIDLTGVDVLQELLKCGTLEIGAGEATVIVALGQERPSVMGTARDVLLAGLALGIERVE